MGQFHLKHSRNVGKIKLMEDNSQYLGGAEHWETCWVNNQEIFTICKHFSSNKISSFCHFSSNIYENSPDLAIYFTILIYFPQISGAVAVGLFIYLTFHVYFIDTVSSYKAFVQLVICSF